jgi:putative pyruvate formate lyase activating enzyme
MSSEGWDNRIGKLYKILESCRLCPRECKVNRTQGEKGYCKSGKELVISSIGPHFGEEPPLVGRGGSGTIFLTRCNLGCIYCQNYDISHLGYGDILSCEKLADGMINLQDIGCHNINLVTPTHFVPQLVKSIKIARDMGLKVPIVYNCGGYESLEAIKLLEGIVDIYMPDIKYSNPRYSELYSRAPDYFEKCSQAVCEMHRQVGDLKIEEGIAKRGLIIRHLVLPNRIGGSKKVMEFISREISKNSYVNIMFQYRPLYQANKYKELNRSPRLSEYNEVIEMAKEVGLHRGFQIVIN